MSPRYDDAAWCPWAEADKLGATVRYVEMTGGLLGTCNWVRRRIYIRRGITLDQKLCIAAHEVLHLQRGPLMCVSEHVRQREEASISRQVAGLLIPLGRLIDALAWSPHLGEQAEMLAVDRFTMRTRLGNLSQAERRAITGIFGEEAC